MLGQRISFRESHTKRQRTGNIIKAYQDGYHVKVDRLHIWGREEDLIYYVSRDSIP